MRILVLADIHGDFETLKKIVDDTKHEGIDLVICPGDFTDIFATPKEFDQIDMAELIIQKILSLKIPVFCVPGNHDPYEIIEVFNEFGTNLHNKKTVFKGMPFIGFGGAATPFNTKFEPSDEEIKESLEKNSSGLKPGKFILVVHNPPKNTKLDLTASGQHVGSEAVRNFIIEKKPVLSLSAHIHESRGEDKLGSSILFYPGAVFEGYYGIIEIEGKGIKTEIKKI